MIDDGSHQPQDKKEAVVILTRIGDDYRIDRNIQGFGYTQGFNEDCDSYLKYPFIFDVEKNHVGMAKLNYEGWDLDGNAKTNITTKDIREGDVFTLFLDQEYTYRMDKVTVL